MGRDIWSWEREAWISFITAGSIGSWYCIWESRAFWKQFWIVRWETSYSQLRNPHRMAFRTFIVLIGFRLASNSNRIYLIQYRFQFAFQVLMIPWSRGWYRLVEFAGSQIIRVFLSGHWLARISATADWWAEKLSIRRATFRPVILESNQRINSIKIWVVIQAFELLRQNRLKFRILMPAALKACGFRAFPINQGSSFSEPSALQQNRAESLAFSFFRPGSCWVERLRAGVCFQRSAVSSQLNWSLRL